MQQQRAYVCTFVFVRMDGMLHTDYTYTYDKLIVHTCRRALALAGRTCMQEHRIENRVPQQRATTSTHYHTHRTLNVQHNIVIE